jgi:predicted signal transduction protein with EAL and GGDEF domain
MRASLRAGDLSARIGGDEFAVLIERGGSVREAVTVAQRLIDALGAPYLVGEQEALVGASVGIAAARLQGEGRQSAFELLRNADIAMYTAKSEGKGRFAVYEPTVHTAIMARHELSGELARAVLRGELEVFYQPIVELGTGRVVGAEALVRWRHPVRGLIGPDHFIRLAEENATIHALGRFVLASAAAQVAAWDRSLPDGRRLQLSVNLSPKQLLRVDFVEEVELALAAAGLQPADLVLEMTETAMFQDTQATIARLRALRALGIRVALDDFGTGYSSLGYLRRFPVDILKIAREFIAGQRSRGGSEDDAWPFARAILALGRSLGLTLVAEGIEDREQLRKLRRLGCQQGQGFLFARPMPAAGFGELLRLERAPGWDGPQVVAGLPLVAEVEEAGVA